MALGKGLESLIPRKVFKDDMYYVAQGDSVFNIEIDKIMPNPDQPRRNMREEELMELAQSIREHGILQPIIVTKVEKETERGSDVRYQIIAGERRWRAAQLANLPHVPAIVRGVTKLQNLELALVENIQRENLNVLEEARAYSELRSKFGLTQKDIAQKVGKSRESVANTLRMLQLSEIIQKALLDNQITFAHAKILLSAPEENRENLMNKSVEHSWTVQELTNALGQMLSGGQVTEETERSENISAPVTGMDPRLKEIENKLSEILGLNVRVRGAGDGGKIIIKFSSQPELSNILKLFGR